MNQGYSPIFRILMASLCVVCSGFLSHGANAGVNSWTYSGPSGGAIRKFVASPANDAIMYIAMERSLHKSVDGGATWQAIRHFNGHVDDLAVSPSNPNFLLVSVQEAGLLRSLDGGETFATVATAPFFFVPGVAVTSGTLYYVNAIGFFASPDGGVTWQSRAPVPNGVTRIVVDDTNPNLIHTYYPGQAPEIHRSVDGGMSWSTRVLPMPQGGHVWDLVVMSPLVLVAATDFGIMLSIDGGVTWTARHNCNCRAVAKDPRTPNSLLAAGGHISSQGQLYGSDDGGTSWSFLASTPHSGAEAIIVRNQAPMPIVIANSIVVQRSSDNGASWFAADPGPAGSIRVEFATANAPTPRLFAYAVDNSSSAIGLFAWIDSKWERRSLAQNIPPFSGFRLGQAVFKIKPQTAGTLIMAASGYGIVRSTDGGVTWNSSSGINANSLSFKSLDFDPGDPNVIYAGGLSFSPSFSGILYRSTNGGGAWTPAGLNIPNSFTPTRLIIDPANPQRRFAVASALSNLVSLESILLRSTDGGQSWQTVLPLQVIEDVVMHPTNSNYVFVATGTGLRVSENGGASFNANTSLSSFTSRGVSAVAVDPEVPDTLFVLTAGPSGFDFDSTRWNWVLRSVDRGQNWEVLRAETESPSWSASRLVLDPSNPATVHVSTGARGVGTFDVGSDLAATILGHSGVRPIGAASNFQVRVQNHGPYAATRVRVATAFPAGMSNVTGVGDGRSCVYSAGTLDCEIAVLRSGTSATVSVTYTAPTAMNVQTSVVVSGHERETFPGNNSHSAFAQAVEVVDLRPAIVPAASAVNVGEPLNISVQAINNGPSTSSAAMLSIDVPTGLTVTAVSGGCSVNVGEVVCSVGSLAAGATRSFTLSTLPSVSGTQTLEARIAAAAGATDLNPTNNTAIASALVRPSADLAVTVVDSIDPVLSGGAFDYRVDVYNSGPQSVSNVVARLVRTGGVSSTITSTHGGCASDADGIRCDLGPLDAGVAARIVLTVTPGGAGTVALQASVTSDANDTAIANNSAQESTMIQSRAQERSGGGGAFDWRWLAGLAALLCLRVGPRRTIAGIVTFASLGFVSIAHAGMNTWTMRGPPGGIVSEYLTSPSNDNVIYAYNTNAQYRSSDGGVTWETISYLFQPLAFAVDPANSNRFYISIATQGLYRTDDGGRTLSLLAANSNLSTTSALAASTTALYRTVTDSSFQRSSDQGLTWERRSTTPEPFSRLIVNDANPNLIFASSIFGANLFRSRDGGVTWTRLTITAPVPGVGAVSRLVQAGPSTWVAIAPGGLYTSIDEGTTWTRTAFGAFSGLAADPSNPGTLIAIQPFSGRSLLRSTNSGATWTSSGGATNFFANGLLVHRSGQITALSEEGVFYSNNGGATWNESAQGFVASFTTEVVASSGSGGRVYSLGYGRNTLFHTIRDEGWQRLDLTNTHSLLGASSSPSLLAVRPGSNNTLVTNTAPARILQSFDGGASWRRGNAPAGLNPSRLFYAGNPLALFAYAPSDSQLASQPGGLFRSADDGMTWTPHSVDLSADFIYTPRIAVDPLDPQRMYMVASTLAEISTGARFYRSNDGGAHWQRGLEGIKAYDVKVHPADSRVYVATRNGLQISTDGGATFSQNNPFSAWPHQATMTVAFDPQFPATMYVTSAGADDAVIISNAERSSIVLRSVDGGQTWETVRAPLSLPFLNINQLVLDPSKPSILYTATFGLGVAAFEVAPDLLVMLTGHSGARSVGQSSSFDLRAENAGPYAANNVRLSAALPTGATITGVTIDRGTCTHSSVSVACSLGLMHVGVVARARVNYQVTAPAALLATAAIEAHERDSEPGNSTAQSLAYSGQVADLRVDNVATVASANVGDVVTYSVQARNLGPTNAGGATLTFTPSTNQFLGAAPPGCALIGPSIVCNTGPLAVAGVINYAFRTSVQANGSTAAAGVSLVPDAATIDPDAVNNTAIATIAVRPRGDLSVSVEDTVDPASPGVDFEYRIVVRNAGPDTLPNAAVALINTGNTVRVSSSTGSCTLSTCILGNLPANATATINVVANSNTLGTMSLRANVSSDGDDRATVDNTDREFTSIATAAPNTTSGESHSKGGDGNFQIWFVALLGFVLLAMGIRHRARFTSAT